MLSPTRKYFQYTLLLLVVCILASCSIQRRIPEGKVYFKNHQIVLHDSPTELPVSNDELLALSKLKPNRRILWVRLNMRINTWFVPQKALDKSSSKAKAHCMKRNERRKTLNKPAKECRSLWMWLAYTVGESPALLDSSKVEKTADQMTILLQKNGYFQNKVEPEYQYENVGLLPWKKRQKCVVKYHITPNDAYHLRNINYVIDDKSMAKKQDDLLKSSLIDTSMVFSVNLLEQERTRIADYFNNSGYYEFTKDYIVYDADSTVGNKQVDVTLRLKMPSVPSSKNPDEMEMVPHKKYFLNKIYVNTDYKPTSGSNDVPQDTLLYNGLYILSKGKPALRPSLLHYTTTLSPGEVYRKDKVERTYKRFVTLGTSRSVNVQLVPRSQVDSSGYYLLDAYVLLTPAKKQTLSLDPRLTNRSGNMGIYSNLVYRHKNLNRGAESLEFRIVTGFEASQVLGQSANTNTTSGIQGNFNLNTFEIGPEVTLSVPRLFPFGYRNSKRSKDPHTNFKGILNYQKRPDYERTLSQFGYGWSLVGNPDKITRYTIDWVEFSIIKIKKSEGFQDLLDRLSDEFLANSYRDHLILASRVGFYLNTQKSNFQRQTFYYKTSLEGAGNALRLAYNLSNQPKDELGSYEINGIRFAQYVKTEHDFRYYFNANERNVFVLRTFGGLGIPLKNFNVLPFEKSFFVGGANGIRAWQARTLGPGSYRDSTQVRTFNNIGSVKLEANFEYRFKLTQMFQAALFVDAGNVWLLKQDGALPGADFDSKRFLSEIAIGAGAGMRLDFDYFLVRLDLGLPLKDPLKVPGERWAWQPKTEYNEFLNSRSSTDEVQTYRLKGILNLGIGFPF